MTPNTQRNGSGLTSTDDPNLHDRVSRTETAQNRFHADHAERIAALYDQSVAFADGDPLPPLWHWYYFAPTTVQSGLGPDGHPERTGFMPPISLPRRMWAGGRLVFHKPLRVGETVTRDTEILSIKEKSGKQGDLLFLTLGHRLTGGNGLAVEEEQDIVYRGRSTTKPPASEPGTETPAYDWQDSFLPDPVALFRFSALTFNAHRIHYDLPYATQEEGYPGLVMQGPLTATLLMKSFRDHTSAEPRSFSFRGKAPLYSGGTVTLRGRLDKGSQHALWAEGPGGYTAMTATISTS